MPHSENSPNYRRRRVVAAGALAGALAGGALFAHNTIGDKDETDSRPPVTGLYKVGTGEDATKIGREFATDSENIIKIRDEVQSQAGEDGILHPGDIVAIERDLINNPNAPTLQMPDDMPNVTLSGKEQ